MRSLRSIINNVVKECSNKRKNVCSANEIFDKVVKPYFDKNFLYQIKFLGITGKNNEILCLEVEAHFQMGLLNNNSKLINFIMNSYKELQIKKIEFKIKGSHND